MSLSAFKHDRVVSDACVLGACWMLTTFHPQVVGEFDYVSAYNNSGVLTTVYTPVGKAEQVNELEVGMTGNVDTHWHFLQWCKAKLQQSWWEGGWQVQQGDQHQGIGNGERMPGDKMTGFGGEVERGHGHRG